MTGLILMAVAGTIAAGLDMSTVQPPEAFVGTLTQITVAASLPPPGDNAQDDASAGTAAPMDRPLLERLVDPGAAAMQGPAVGPGSGQPIPPVEAALPAGPRQPGEQDAAALSSRPRDPEHHDGQPSLPEVADAARALDPATLAHPPPAPAAIPPVPVPTPGPRVAILLIGLGLDPVLAGAASELPLEVALGWSVYADDPLAGQQEAARRGREIWLELPVSHGDPSRFDRGPLALSPARSDARNLQLLKIVLGKAAAPAGVVADPGAFAPSPERFQPIGAALSVRHLGLMLYGPFARMLASEPGLVAAAANGSLPVTTLPGAIDGFLETLSQRAENDGAAVGVVQAHPLAIARLLRWQADLADRGLTLVRPSVLLQAPPGGQAADVAGHPALTTGQDAPDPASAGTTAGLMKSGD